MAKDRASQSGPDMSLKGNSKDNKNYILLIIIIFNYQEVVIFYWFDVTTFYGEGIFHDSETLTTWDCKLESTTLFN